MNKRLIAVVLAFVMMFVFSGCNSDPKTQETTETPETTVSVETTNSTEETEFVGVVNPFEEMWQEQEATEEIKSNEVKPTESKPSSTKPTEPKATEPKATEPKATEPKATEPKATEPKATEPKVTEPEATEPKVTEPKPTEPKPTEPAPAVGETEYEKYMSMSGAEQKAYMESFGSVEAFFNWLQSAKAEYEAAHPDIEIGADGKAEIG